MLFVMTISFSCNIQTNNDSINIQKQLSKTVICDLSNFADSISYIILETNDNCLLPANSSILYIDSKDVFIRGGNYLYRFDRNGKFKNRIGQIGGGPQEYSNLYDADVDYNKNIVLVMAPPGNVYIYEYGGDFIEKISLNNNSQTITYLTDTTFACIVNKNIDGRFSTFLMTYNDNGESVQQQLLITDSRNFERSILSVPILYKSEDFLKIKFPHNDTIYIFTGEGIYFSHILYTGKYRPDREIVEDMRYKEDLMNNYLQIVDIVETNGYAFLLSIFKRDFFAIVYNKHTNKFLFSKYINSPKQGGGVRNDLTKQGNFWPMISFKDLEGVAQLIYPKDAGLANMDDDSNQVIQIVYLKTSELDGR